MLATCVSPGFNGEHKTLPQWLSLCLSETGGHGVDHPLADKAVTHGHEPVRRDVALPIAVAAAGTCRRVALGVDHTQLAGFNMRVDSGEGFDDFRRRFSGAQ